MLTRLFQFVLITSLKLLQVYSNENCDKFYDSERGVLKLQNDFSGWYKLKVGVLVPLNTNNFKNISLKTNIDDLETIQDIEYLLDVHVRNGGKVLNVTLNKNVLCTSDIKEGEKGTFVLLEDFTTIEQARINSKECGSKPPVNPFFVSAPVIATPWLVAIYASINGKYEYACAGNLITDRHLLSVAQCFSGQVKEENFVVVLGISTLVHWVKHGTLRGIAEIFIHEEYKLPTANIALIRLDQPVKFTNKIKPVCLFHSVYAETGLLSGWGSSESGKELLKLRQLPMSIIKQEDCFRLDAVYYKLNSNRSFCAGATATTRGKTPCLGDHGGGLTVEYSHDSKKLNLKGIVSIIPSPGGQCNRDLYPVLTDVVKFKEWIIMKVGTSH